MDQTPPDPAPSEPAAPDERVTRRLQSIVGAERIVAWSRGWVSREVPLHAVFAARTLDFAVVTDRSLFLVSTGFFTRRPFRCVFSSALDDLAVAFESVPRGRRVLITPTERHTLRIELNDHDRAKAFSSALDAAASGTHRP